VPGARWARSRNGPDGPAHEWPAAFVTGRRPSRCTRSLTVAFASMSRAFLWCGADHDGGDHSAVAEPEPVACLGDQFERRSLEEGEAGLVGGNVDCLDVADGHGARSGPVALDQGHEASAVGAGRYRSARNRPA